MKVTDIPTDTFNAIVDELRADGWTVTDEYDNFDAWIDYGRLVMVKNGAQVTLEWDNWFEGSIEGEDGIVRDIISGYDLKRSPA